MNANSVNEMVLTCALGRLVFPNGFPVGIFYPEFIISQLCTAFVRVDKLLFKNSSLLG